MTGLSPNQYHLNLRITRAQELLESTLLNIEEVADQTGFENIYYFSKIFKKKVGTSPKVYRKQFF
jgi:transcriptional regulator GlxA family with amidase domain